MSIQNPWQLLRTGKGPDYEKFRRQFDGYNQSIGNSLIQLETQPQDIQGRDKEIKMLYRILERPKTPIALLLGEAGVGKTALIEEFTKQLNSGTYNTHLNYIYMPIALRLGSLSSIGPSKLQSAIANLLNNMKRIEEAAQRTLRNRNLRVILFMDEIHMLVTIFGPGTKIGGDLAKDVLARSPVRVVTATTRREYDIAIATDPPFAQRFKPIEISELSKDIVLDVCLNWWSKVAPDLRPLKKDLITRIIDANEVYRSDAAEPRKTIDIMEDLVSLCRIENREPTDEDVDDIFSTRYSINLSFNINPDEVYSNVTRRVKGQPYALETMRRAIRSMIFQLDPNSNKPLMTLLFTGPTGVGKTETVKALAEGLYPGENVLTNINMPDFKTPQHNDVFLKRLGETVRHTPKSIVLLDEFEKANETILDSLLAILDEGIVKFNTVNMEGKSDVHEVSLRNTIIIATTNAGSKVFNNDALTSQRDVNDSSIVSDAEIQQLMKSLQEELESNGFKPEMLGRFNRIIPYRSLSESDMISIAEMKIRKLIKSFELYKGIHLEMEEPHYWNRTYPFTTTNVALDIVFVRADIKNPSSGGARAIQRHIDDTLKDEIVDAVLDNPGFTHFEIDVSRSSKIYDSSADKSEKGVIIRAIK